MLACYSLITDKHILSQRTINPLAMELDIDSLAHHLCKLWIYYEQRRV